MEQSPGKVEYSKSLKVLIIEDSLVDRRMLESMLTEQKKLTSKIKSVDSLKSAKKLLKSQEFDVLILDLNVSDAKGEESLFVLRKDFPNIPIVVNTGAYEDEVGVKTLGIGAQDFLIKGKYNSYGLTRVLRFAIERKRLENELTKAYNELKETQDQLIRSEKMKVVGGLASGVAHEVKNPLATIVYGTTYLIEQLMGDRKDIDKALVNIKEAADRANVIANDLLDFAQMSRLNECKEDLNLVINKSLGLVHHEFEKRRIRLKKKLDSNVSKVKIDKNRIEQVVVNLLLNATFALKKGGVIEIKCYQKKLSSSMKEIPQVSKNGFKPGQDLVFITVDDNGCGIPEEKLQNIFEPFFTTRRAKGGVGLGLSVCQTIMNNHHGGIYLENRKRGGVRATLAFKV